MLTFAFGFVIVVFNRYAAWETGLLPTASREPVETSPGDATSALSDMLIEQWVASGYMELPGVGVRISVADLSLWGAIVCFFAGLAQWSLSKRQSLLVGQLVAEMKGHTDTTRLDREHAYWSIIQEEFLVVPYSNSRQGRPFRGRIGVVPSRVARFVLLSSLPIVVAVGILTDVTALYTAVLRSPFRVAPMSELLSSSLAIRAQTFVIISIVLLIVSFVCFVMVGNLDERMSIAVNKELR